MSHISALMMLAPPYIILAIIGGLPLIIILSFIIGIFNIVYSLIKRKTISRFTLFMAIVSFLHPFILDIILLIGGHQLQTNNIDQMSRNLFLLIGSFFAVFLFCFFSLRWLYKKLQPQGEQDKIVTILTRIQLSSMIFIPAIVMITALLV